MLTKNCHVQIPVINLLFSSIRLDQTLGKPGAWFVGNDRDKQKMTIAARLARVENQVRPYEFSTK